MRSFGFRLPVWILVAILWAGIGSTVPALGHHGDAVATAYVVPSTTTLAVPTSYVVSSWVEPAAYVVPSYYAAAYWVDPVAVVQPSYITTTRVRTGLLGRTRIVQRSAVASYGTTYLPTSYYVAPVSGARSYLPTVWDYPVVWESAYVVPAECVCPPAVAWAAPPRPSSPSTAAPRTGSSSRSIESQPTEESTMSSDVGAPPRGPAVGAGAAASPGSAQPVRPYPEDTRRGSEISPPPPPAPEARPPGGEQAKGQPEQSKGQPGAGAAAARPAAGATATQTNPNAAGANPNAAGVPFPPPTAPLPPQEGAAGESRHEVQRPAYSTPARRPSPRGVLFGIVQSSASGEMEEGVRVTLTNPSDRTLNKGTTTDALGRFAVRLSDGDWTVNVTMPSGRVYPVSQVRVSNGQITDPRGNRIPSLEITR